MDIKKDHAREPVWKVHDPDFGSDTEGGITVFLIKVLYKDGSHWDVNREHACSLAVSGRPKARKDEDD